MGAARFSPRIFWLILADAAFLYSGVLLAMYLRLGTSGSQNELNAKNGWLKIALASAVCLLILYFYDLYDYIVMTNRRELLLRLVQALGIAWVLLALLFYFVPPLLIGRGVSVISVPIVLGLLLGWRIFIHLLTGHPDIGEKILVVGTGQTALDTAEAVWERRDAGYRIVGFVTENGGKHPQRVGLQQNSQGEANEGGAALAFRAGEEPIDAGMIEVAAVLRKPALARVFRALIPQVSSRSDCVILLHVQFSDGSALPLRQEECLRCCFSH